MKHKFLFATLTLSLLITACGTAVNAATETPEAIPTVIADDTIIAEGRVEPAQYAEIAFGTSGVVSEVLVEDGQPIKKGDALIRLGDESDVNYAAAQLELVTAQQALNDLQDAAGSDLAQTIIDLKDAKEVYEKADHYLNYLQTAQKVPQTDTKVILNTSTRPRTLRVRPLKTGSPKRKTTLP